MHIKQTVVLITGGGSGIGAATARHLASLGALVALIDCNSDAVNSVANEIHGLGLVADVTDEEQVAQAIETIQSEWGGLRVLINCAGIAPAKRILGKAGVMPLSDFQHVLQVNVIGTFNVLRLAAMAIATAEPLDSDGNRGVIINTASIAAYEGQIGQAAYSASKAAIVGLTLPAARELANVGIRVMTIAPGLMKTPLLQAFPAEVQFSLAQSVNFPKRLGEPNEFARLAAHIIDNDYLNGEVIRLDGALRMREK